MKYISEIRGASFRGKAAVALVASLASGEAVTLESDSENPYDPNAVMVIARGEFVGYVQKELSAVVSSLLPATAYVQQRMPLDKKTYIVIEAADAAVRTKPA